MEPLVIALDVETTTHNNGNPFDSRNKLVCFSWAYRSGGVLVEGAGPSFPDLPEADRYVIVGFNFKFDYNWLIRDAPEFRAIVSKSRIWDVQLAHFVLSGCLATLPSLNDVLTHYNLDLKLDVVKEEYWNKGIDTDAIPPEILYNYAQQDARQTYLAFEKQLQETTLQQKRLIYLMGEDLRILSQMESNGCRFDEEMCENKSKELDEKIEAITGELRLLYPNVNVNWNSGDHVSAVLYGGKVTETVKVHSGFYKTGIKAGQPKYSNQEVVHEFPPLFKPLKGTALKKEGFFATDEGTLRKLPKNKHYHIVEKLLALARLEKLNGTYYKGLLQLNRNQNWPRGTLHGQYNQSVVRSGRLSCSRPNMQNMASDLQDILISKYDE